MSSKSTRSAWESQRALSLRTKLVGGMVSISITAMLVAAGCNGSDQGGAQVPTAGPTTSATASATASGTATPRPSGSNAYQIPFIAQSDVQYIDAIVPHHRHAIEMSEIELANGSSAQAKALARQFKAKQMEEIALLQRARQALTGNPTVPPPPSDPHNMPDLARQRAARGAAADKEFLDNMIPHHAEGISIAHRAYPNLRRADVIANANDVYNTQAREIGQMIALRGQVAQTGR